MTVTLIVVVSAFLCAIANALGKCPAWVPLILLCLAMMLQVVPR